MIFRSVVMWLLLCVPVFAEYPYDSICEIYVKPRAWARKSIGGSGTLVFKSNGGVGYVLTAKHVALDINKRSVCQFNGMSVDGVTFAVHTKADLALIRVEQVQDVGVVPIAMAREDSGPFLLMGYSGYDRNHLRWQQGDFLAFKDGDKKFTYDAIFVSCVPEGGMSGGPCFDRYGRVVGVVSASMKDRGSKSHEWGSCIGRESLFELMKTVPQ